MLEISFSILFNLTLASIKILLCFFFLFLVISNNFFIIPVVKENTRLKLSFAIPTGTLITFVKEIILFVLLISEKKLKLRQNNQKQQCISLVFCSLFFFLNL